MALNPAQRRRIAQAQTSIQKDPVIRDGQYTMLIKEMRIIDASITGVGDMFASYLKVLQASAITQGVEPNPAGSDCASKCNLSTNRAAMSNVKGMIAGALGFPDPMAIPEDQWNQILDWVFSDQQPMRGMLIAGSTFRTIIKGGANRGQPFVGVNWSQAQNNSPAEIAQRRAQLDATDPIKPPQVAAQQQQQQQYGQQGMAPQPQYGAPQYGAPQGMAPQYGAPQGMAPQPQYGAPQVAAPQQPQYGGAPQGMPPQYGAPPLPPQPHGQQTQLQMGAPQGMPPQSQYPNNGPPVGPGGWPSGTGGVPF